MLRVVDLLEVWRGAGAGGLWTRPGGRGRVSQWRFLTRAGGARLRSGPPEGPPHASQPMLRVEVWPRRSGGRSVHPEGRARVEGERARGGERARVTMAVSDTRAPGGRAAAG
eukprot:scaffold2995_cov120-Isochrysis_galbana.AAC.5